MKLLAVLVLCLTVAPSTQRSELRLENAHVRVVENLYEPGAESPLHTHEWPRVVYVLDGGVLELVAEDGTVTRVRVRPGETLWRPAETHVVRNIGRTTVRTLETGVKAAGE